MTGYTPSLLTSESHVIRLYYFYNVALIPGGYYDNRKQGIWAIAYLLSIMSHCLDFELYTMGFSCFWSKVYVHKYNASGTKFELQHGLLPKPHFPPPVLHSVYIRGSRVQDDIMHSYVGPISFVHLSVYDAIGNN